MYADETVIYFTSSNLSELELNLNLELVNLSRWLNLNKLILNVKKTECMVFGTRQRLASQNSDTIDLNIHGPPITPFAVHYEKIRNHLRETAINYAKRHSLARKYEHLRKSQIQ